MKRSNLSALAVMAAMSGPVALAASPADAERLGKDLTPAGAERAGNRDGSIPAWTGESPMLKGWSFGKYRGDFFKYKDDKPLFVIDGSNLDKYGDKLAPGQVAMIKQNRGYSMPVYASRRSCTMPDFVQSNTRQNATGSKIGADGWSMTNAALPGVPFPIPSSGIEAVWNHLARYQGAGSEYPSVISYISPKPGGDRGIQIRYRLTQYWPNGTKGEKKPEPGALFQGLFYAFIEPAAFSGQAAVSRFFFDKPSENYYYFTGQRRVRRLPSFDYDAPQIGYENQLAIDQTNVFYGTPDRFDWKIVGKKEMYIPYNSFGVTDVRKKVADVAKPGTLSPDIKRYELHRVWVLEGTVKAGLRHLNPRRTLYLDEDSWIAVGGEDYDAQGQVWKWKESAPYSADELGGACVAPAYTVHDLISGRYIVDGLSSEGKDHRWFLTPDAPEFKESFYTSENLQRVSDR